MAELAGSVLNFQFLGETVDAGFYPLISATGGITGDLADIILQGLPTGSGGRQSFALSTTTLPNTLTLDVSGKGAVLVWNNAANTGLWNTTDANWNNNGNNDKFLPGDIVRLEDTANASETINLVGTLEPVSLTAANTPATTFILDGNGSLAGVTGLAANGGGTVVIRNTNSFEGNLSVTNASRVALENPAALRDDGTVSITGGTLDLFGTTDTSARGWTIGANGATIRSADGSTQTWSPNAIEWVLGGTKDANDLAKLPASTTPDGNFVVSFTRAKASKTSDTTVRIQVGTSLAAWPLSFDVATAPEITVTDIDDNWEQVTLTLTRFPDVSKFARLEVSITP